ncbi:universal stress protein [Pedobacter sp. GSP4]|uniref:universal stress protein n=1 Tax=Pedobacter sp. GSP4 TaxID=3453716 RepID=UPI003EEFE626
MKKILVPVDFSATAENAADYATDLAHGIGARVELLNIFQVPEFSPVAASLVWPIEEYKLIEDNAKKALGKMVERVEEKYKKAHHEPGFKAEVFGRLIRGEVGEEVGKYFTEGKMNLVVTGLNHADNLTKMFMGSAARKIIGQEIPVLLVPAGYRFKKPKKIAFATDFSHSDVPVLCALAEFAKPFSADILIMHTGHSASDLNQSADFLNRIADRVNYRHIYHRYVNSQGIKEGLDWIVENGQIDILAMVHRKHDFFYRLFNGSYTMNMSDHIPIPLLALPPEHKVPM